MIASSSIRGSCPTRASSLAMLLALVALAWGGFAPDATAQPGSERSAFVPPATSTAPRVEVGIAGHYRAGSWTAIRFHGDAPTTAPLTAGGASWGVETLDGDGVRVIYRQTASFARGGFGYAVPGSEAAPLILHQGDQTRWSTRFPTAGVAAEGPAMIPRSMPWVVVVGDPLGVETIGANALLDRPASVAVSRPSTAAAFPDRAIGYEGVDLVMITGSGSGLLGEFQPAQQRALRRWLLGGGRVLITLGASTPRLLATAPWISELLPESLSPLRTTTIDPSALEAYMSTETRLETFEGADLPREMGQVMVLGRTTRRVSTPIAANYVVGLGRVSVIAGDLESEPFAQWPERLALITRLTGDLFVQDTMDPGRQSRATSFDDLAGQMRLALDRFATKRHFSFSMIALIILALIALVGPLDYLVVNRLFGRPLLGWLTFPLVAVAFSAFLIWQATPVPSRTLGEVNATTKPSETKASAKDALDVAGVECNRIEIADIDLANRVGRGFVWSYLYTHEAQQLSVRAESTEALRRLEGSWASRLVAPFGYPGHSFGGVQIVGDDARIPPYEVALDEKDDVLTSTLTSLALAPRSSKSLGIRYHIAPDLPVDVTVRRRRGSELLAGSVTNPLPFDLLDGMLIYRNWAYLLPTRFRAGATVDSVDALRQKNFRWQLSRQRAIESASESEAWNPADYRSLDRIAEMLMFHKVVGGRRYTTLHHQVLSDLDQSDLLVDDRCLLLGRLDTPLSQLMITTADDARGPETLDRAAPAMGRSLTLLRVLIPVEPTSD